MKTYDFVSFGMEARSNSLQADVFNGIAYRANKGTFFVTGKNWSRALEVKLNWYKLKS